MAAARRWLMGARDATLGLLYPPACAVCGRTRPESALKHLCAPCAKKLPRLEPPYCEVCGEWFVGQLNGAFRCSNCNDRKFDFDFAYAPMRAQDSMRELVHRYKYGGALWLRLPLAELLATAVRGENAEPRLAAEPDWLLVPVPLHPRRLREREFNQAAELCRVLARLTGLPMCEALRRTRYTTVQASLHRSQRLENLRGAFSLRGRKCQRGFLRGRAVLLVDDVLTTGATTQECARVLRRDGGARRVAVLTVVRG
jgi:ComF family protein